MTSFMNRRGLILCSAVLLMLTAIGPAAAQSSRIPSRTSYSGLDGLVSWAATWGDAKREGVYTCAEWKAYATRIFNEADRNHDGYLDAKEFEAIRKADPMFKEADIGYFDDNRDGRVSRSEFLDTPNPFFARYDRKGTCRVTLDDIAAQNTPPAPHRAAGPSSLH